MTRLFSIVAVLLAAMIFAAPFNSAHAATASWCLGQVNNGKILSSSVCPEVIATDDSGTGLEVFLRTQDDVLIEQFGAEFGPALTSSEITSISNTLTIKGQSLGGESDGTLTWLLNSPTINGQMDGFGNFDLVLNVDGPGANAGVSGTGTGFTAGSFGDGYLGGTLDAALYFYIAGFTIADFEAIFSPNCHPSIGCLQAAKVSSEQYADLIKGGGYVSNVPLPGAVWLVLSAIGGLLAIGRRRRRLAQA